ncbi:MAG TPA: TRAP transporter permease [Oligoflexia bacterium]|nr:TRAP transporter permease [Oligoflexia bacterium]HMR25114.1 TRAP transporter permease [Oligoflexia bacterium]
MNNKTIKIILCIWSTFQLASTQYIINDTLLRSIHLSFAIGLAFFMFVPKQSEKEKINKLMAWGNIFLGCLAALAALYLALDYQGISQRPGLPIVRDIVAGSILIVCLLEASRRVLGIALSLVAIVFMLFAFFGPYFPQVVAHRGADIGKMVSHLYLGTEGIFGVPIRVSASFVFLFVLLGSLLDKAGAGQYFIELAYSALGKFRGGPAKASVAASGLLGMLSGSSIANTVTTGTFTIPLMKKIGFTPEKAAAIEVAASTNAQLMPPVMGAAAFIMAEFLGIGYMEVVKAAIIPALASYVALFAVVHFEACKLNIQASKAQDIPPFFKTLWRGVHYCIPIVFLIYTLMIKRQSPTASAFNAIVITILIILIEPPIKAFLNKRLKQKDFTIGFKNLIEAFAQGAQNMIPIAIATACAGIIIGVVTMTGLGQSLLQVIELASGGNFYLVLILTAISCIILGMGLPTTANYIVMASLTAPILASLAKGSGLMIPVIAIHLFVFYFGILADDTPPVGLAAYAAAAIAKSDPIKTGIQGFIFDMRTAALPFIFILNTQFILIKDVVPGGNPMRPADWIWNDSLLSALGFLLAACIGMIFFVSAITGWFKSKLRWWERLWATGLFLGIFLYPQVLQYSGLSLPIYCALYCGLALLFIRVQIKMANR